MTWKWAAGMAWLVIGIFGVLTATLALLLSLVMLSLLPFGLVLVIGGVSVPLWLTYQIWYERSTGWALFAFGYGLWLAWAWPFMPLSAALLISVAGFLSLFAARELSETAT